MINEPAVPLHWPNRKGREGRGGEAGSERLQHIAGNKDRHNTPLCIAYSCLFIAAVSLLTAASRTTLERKKPAPDSYRAVCDFGCRLQLGQPFTGSSFSCISRPIGFNRPYQQPFSQFSMLNAECEEEPYQDWLPSQVNQWLSPFSFCLKHL